MNRNIRLLEERVLQATKRLRQLSDDRTMLEQEVQSLRDRLETVEKAEPVDSGAAVFQQFSHGRSHCADVRLNGRLKRRYADMAVP